MALARRPRVACGQRPTRAGQRVRCLLERMLGTLLPEAEASAAAAAASQGPVVFRLIFDHGKASLLQSKTIIYRCDPVLLFDFVGGIFGTRAPHGGAYVR